MIREAGSRHPHSVDLAVEGTFAELHQIFRVQHLAPRVRKLEVHCVFIVLLVAWLEMQGSILEEDPMETRFNEVFGVSSGLQVLLQALCSFIKVLLVAVVSKKSDGLSFDHGNLGGHWMEGSKGEIQKLGVALGVGLDFKVLGFGELGPLVYGQIQETDHLEGEDRSHLDLGVHQIEVFHGLLGFLHLGIKNHKQVVQISSVKKNLTTVFEEPIFLQVVHHDVGVARSHLGAHGSARQLVVELVAELEVVVGEHQFY